MVAVVLGVVCSSFSCAGPKEAAVGELRADPGLLSVPFPGSRELRLDLMPTAVLAGAEPPILFVHLISEPGDVLRTFDQPLPSPWRLGERQRFAVRIYQSAMARPLPAGRYGLSVGLYQPGGRRWPLKVGGEEVDRYEYRVAEIEVPPVNNEVARFEFSSGWSDPEVGNDLQVLARRWLGEEGQIMVAGLKPPGRLWLALRIPPAPERGVRVLAAGQSSPALKVTSTCGDLEIGISGIGRQEIEIPVVGAEERMHCSLTLQPNFYDQREGGFERRSCVLEAIAWIGR